MHAENNSSLRQLIRETLLNEKLRSTGFNFNQFRALEDLHEIYNYALDNLEFLGMGSSRTVFLLSSAKVLKIANWKSQGNAQAPGAGKGQNAAEVDIFSDLKTKSVVARVFDHDQDFLWVISELVRPISSEEEFLRLIDIDPSASNFSFNEIMSLAIVGTENPQPVPSEYLENEKQEELPQKAKDLIYSLNTLYEKYDVLSSDVIRLDHWGKSADGRAVLFDYGYSYDVGVKHYLTDKDRAEMGIDSRGNELPVSDLSTNKKS